jgi:hypothetical protein
MGLVFLVFLILVCFLFSVVCGSFHRVLCSMTPGSAVAETCRMLDLLKLKSLEQLPETIAGDSSGAGNNAGLSAESSGMSGLFRRAQAIGSGLSGAQAQVPVRRVIGGPSEAHGAASSSLSSKRHSAVIMHQQQQQQPAEAVGAQAPTPAAAQSFGGGGGGGDSSLMAEVPDDMLSSLDIRPSEDLPAGAGRVPIAADNAGRLSPLKPSEKSQSLMADLLGGGGGAAADEASSTSGKSKGGSVWD